MDFEKYLKEQTHWHECFHEQVVKVMTAAYNQALEDAANGAADAIRKNEDPINAILSLKKQ